MKTPGQVLSPTPKPFMRYVRIGNSTTVHDLHPVMNRTECRLSTDSAKVQGVKAYTDFPGDAEGNTTEQSQVCEDCIRAYTERCKAKEMRKLNDVFEQRKYEAHSKPRRKNTAGKKQVFNRAQDGFSFDD